MACRRLWGELQAVSRALAMEDTERERARLRRRWRELRALSLRYREVMRREAWARWEGG